MIGWSHNSIDNGQEPPALLYFLAASIILYDHCLCMLLQDSSVPCQIKHLFPDAKFIVVLRDPVYRTLSFMNMARNKCYGMTNNTVECKDDFNPGGSRWPGMKIALDIHCTEWFGDLVQHFKNTKEILRNNEKECLDAFSEGAFIFSTQVLCLQDECIYSYFGIYF